MTRSAKDNLIEDVCEQLSRDGFDGMSKVLEMLMNAAMVFERSKALGAQPYERSEERQGYANGFKPRTFQTRMGELQLQIPQVRGIAFYPGCLEKGQRSEQALKVAIAEMYLNGVSTRKVTKITEYLCGFEVSSTQVSRLAQALDEELKTFLERPLGEFSVVYLDARYEKVRHGGHIKNLAVLWAVGIDELGKRHVLGLSCKLSEAEVHWREFLTNLVTRGLRGVHLIVSDAHQGLCKARESVFPTIPWQRCVVHLMRNANAYIPKKSMQAEVFQDLKDIFNAPSREMAQTLKKSVIAKYRRSAPRLSEWLEENIDQALTYYAFPRKLWKRLRTSNVVERFNRELKRRTRVVSIFPSEKSTLRLVGALLIETHEEWINGPRYLDVETIQSLKPQEEIYRKMVA